MKYNNVDIGIPVRSFDNYYVGVEYYPDSTLLFFLNNNDFSVDWIEKVNEEMFLVSIVDSVAIMYHYSKPNYYYRYKIKERKLERLDGELVLVYAWNNGLELKFDRDNLSYFICDLTGRIIYTLVKETNQSYEWIKFGILIFDRFNKSNSLVKCLDPADGKEKWRFAITAEIIRLETYKGLIILEYNSYNNVIRNEGHSEIDLYNSNTFTLALDETSGSEVWKFPFAYSKIDYENGLILFGNDDIQNNARVLEVDIFTGAIITELLVSPSTEFGYYPYFSDREGIYYKTRKGAFGKVKKTDGVILWEFDLLDDHGNKRRITDWLLLGNGNLVLRSLPYHQKDSDIKCIFNPSENIAFSKVQYGERID